MKGLVTIYKKYTWLISVSRCIYWYPAVIERKYELYTSISYIQ